MNEQNKNELAAKEQAPMAKMGGNIFSDGQVFALAQRMANALASSTIVPKEYQSNLGNCLIALEMSSRLNTSPLMVMQNLYIVNGRPAWSSQYIVAMINRSKKYTTELQFELTGSGDNMECFAFAEDSFGHRVVGPKITMKMAKEEGWLSKNGSKWKTMPEVMIRYRAASFFGRLNCPDMIMGMYTADEVVELDETQYSVLTEQSVKEEIAENANKDVIDVPDEAEETDTAAETDETKEFAADENGQSMIADLP
jgi:hypothetical protein